VLFFKENNILTLLFFFLQVTCKSCFRAFCASCSKPWHPDAPCSTKDDGEEEILRWAKKNFAEKCPKCGCWAQKLHGCDYVKCAACKHAL
jgi:hypothetical protein